MKLKTLMSLIAAMIITTSCSQSSNENDREIKLSYSPVPIVKLEEGKPNDNWIEGKSIYFENLPQQIESSLHLYIENESDSIQSNTIHGFLEHEGKTYDIGIVSSYGLDDVKVSLVDRTFDGIKEIQIIGGIGATYLELKVIGYNSKDMEWLHLLTMGSPEIVDLNGDGQEELVAVSTGSLPGFVEIYKWNVDHFERASIIESTGNTYAFLTNKDGNWIIESAKWVEGQNVTPQYYRYDADKLIEIGE